MGLLASKFPQTFYYWNVCLCIVRCWWRTRGVYKVGSLARTSTTGLALNLWQIIWLAFTPFVMFAFKAQSLLRFCLVIAFGLFVRLLVLVWIALVMRFVLICLFSLSKVDMECLVGHLFHWRIWLQLLPMPKGSSRWRLFSCCCLRFSLLWSTLSTSLCVHAKKLRR